ncbi:MAG: tRNA 2-thiouridine(34) synthase MnmA [Cyanobacteriota bacterium]
MSSHYKKVAVCMSGGVDSSTTALILQEQGYDIVGLTAWMITSGGKCCEQAIVDAAKVCEQIGIEHHIADLRENFQKEVIDYFLKTYSTGRTPNPCVVCNRYIKWGKLLDYAINELKCDYIATGHYAVLEELDGEYKIKRSKDKLKDQTYMLINLTQENLSKTLFPLGHFEKEEVKKMAKENKLPTANNKESQDVCFVISPEKVQDYLERYLGQKPGNIVDCSTGKVIGQHTGVYKYTVGQRKGIKVAYPYPLYVVSIDTENNVVFVGAKEDIESNNLIAENVNWINGTPAENKFYALTKIRYNSTAKLAQLELIDDNSVNVEFEEPQFAITPGQVAAFYSLDNQYLLGGGWIQ